MIARLKHSAGMLVAAVALSTMVLMVVLPSMAEAQRGAGKGATAISRSANRSVDTPAAQSASETPPRVVSPGDSLWSSAQERLGPEATPQQVGSEVEEIYALNRSAIGENPDLILPGWELPVPAASAPQTGSTATSEPVANEPTLNGESASQPTANATPSDEPVSEPATSEPATGDSTEQPGFLQDERRFLGIGILVLTLLVALLMLWKLPMSRDVERHRRRMLVAEYYNYDRPSMDFVTQAIGEPTIESSGTGRFSGEPDDEPLIDKQPCGLAAALKSAGRKKRHLSQISSRGRRRLCRGWASSAYAPQVRRNPRHTSGAKVQRTRAKGSKIGSSGTGKRAKSPQRRARQ